MKTKKHYFSVLLVLLAVLFVSTGLTTTQAAAKVKLNKKSVKLVEGQYRTLKLKGAKKNKVKWTSSNKKIASVKKGVVKAKKAGKCSIIARYAGKKYKCKVKVKKETGKVTMTAKLNEAGDAVELVVSNTKHVNMGMSLNFMVDRWENGSWKRVPADKAVPMPAIARVIFAGDKATQTVSLKAYFDKLPKGKYRIAKSVYGVGISEFIYAEFILESDMVYHKLEQSPEQDVVATPTATPVETPAVTPIATPVDIPIETPAATPTVMPTETPVPTPEVTSAPDKEPSEKDDDLGDNQSLITKGYQYLDDGLFARCFEGEFVGNHVFVLHSRADLEEYWDTYVNDREPFIGDSSAEIYIALNKYDEAYFESHALVVAAFAEPSGSIQVLYNGFHEENGKYVIDMTRKVPLMGTCDMKYWYMFIDTLPKDITDADVELRPEVIEIGEY